MSNKAHRSVAPALLKLSQKNALQIHIHLHTINVSYSLSALHGRNRKIFYEFKLVPPDVERQERTSDIKTARGAARLAGLNTD